MFGSHYFGQPYFGQGYAGEAGAAPVDAGATLTIADDLYASAALADALTTLLTIGDAGVLGACTVADAVTTGSATLADAGLVDLTIDDVLLETA